MRTAKLKARMRRSPASLAGMHYHLEAGTEVSVIGEPDSKGWMRVSTVHDANRRIFSEDTFMTHADTLDFNGTTP